MGRYTRKCGGTVMITLEQFQNMERGTIFYVCAGGRANNLVVERFHSVHELPKRETDTTMILTYCGGMSFIGHLNAGNGCYLTEAEAIGHMARRAKWLHDRETENLKGCVAKAQRKLEEHLSKTEPTQDYVFLDRTNNPEPEGWWYDDTV